MATCSPQTLLTDGACFSCLTTHQKKIVRLQLLCEILSAGGGGGGGVTSIIAGTGISVDQATGAVTITATGGGSGDLLAANNLSDVANAVTSLLNLGGAGGVSATDLWLLSNLPAVQYTAQTYDGDNVVTVGTALWPDGSAGVYTLVTKNATWLCADDWTLTHVDSGKTLTQALVTRNASGYETVTPAITIA